MTDKARKEEMLKNNIRNLLIAIDTEIKTYLVNTDLSIKSIATELNFEDASYMCRYFRRITKMSPIDYRKKSSNLTHE